MTLGCVDIQIAGRYECQHTLVPTSSSAGALDTTQAARLLWHHWQAGTALDALPPGLRPATRTEGHAIQAQLPQVAGRAVAGWKIAATSAAGQAHIGVGGPMAGRILASEVADNGATVSLHGNRMRVTEPEFGLVFGADLPPREQPYTQPQVLAAVATLHPTFEVPNSRFADFAQAGEAQLQADNACCGRFVVGAAAAADWRALDLRALRVVGRVSDGNGCRLERHGDGSTVLGDPRIALTWLVNELSSLGITLAAGQLVSTGTCMVPLEVQAGDTVHADYGVLGSLTLHLSA
jgi:2-keto-4-pentenoate hydratase